MGFKIASERAGHFATPIRTIGSAVQANFPLSNLAEWWAPYRTVRATGNTSGTTYFGLDFGAAFTPVAIIVGNVNVASIKIQGNATDSWGSPSRDSGALTVAQDPLTGRYNYIYEPSSWTTNTRYLRVVSNTATETDSTDVLSVGYMLVLTTLTSYTTPFADPLGLSPSEAVLSTELSGGGDDTVSIGRVRANISIAQSLFASAQESEVLGLLRQNGRSGAFVLYLDDGDTSQVYIVKRSSDAGITITGPNSRSLSPVPLRELI